MSGPAWFLRLRDTAPNWTERYVAVEAALAEGLLDGATLAEYLAAATPAARAQAVLDALADPVTVRVYNGDGTIMGQGTLQTPWATTAAGVITLAEVTSFLVTQSGTPDPASWYLRFESGTRWARGSFGLAGSLAACTWSLPTWQAGQNGTIGTVTIGVPSGSAPSLVGAPSALSFTAGTGGTYDFSVHGTDPDGGALTYSVSPGNILGISLSSAGALSVSSAATAAVRVLTVTVTDTGGLSSSWQVTVTVNGEIALDWHPGHYVTTSGNNITTGAIDTVVNYVNARSYLKGAVIRPFWRQLETSEGVYDFSLIDHALSTLGAGKYFWLQIQTAIFGSAGAGPEDLLPAYLCTPTYDGGAYDDGTDVKTKLWNASVMDRKIALIQALAAEYNTVENFEGVITGETAMSLATSEGTSNYTPAAFATQLQRLFQASRAAFTKKQLLTYVNYISGSGGSNYFQPVLDAARSANYVVGGPDSLYQSPSTGRDYINGTLGTTNYRGKIGIQVGDQTSGLSNTGYSIPALFSTCFTASPGGWGANYGFWLYAPALANFGPAMDYIAANGPACVTAYPEEFP